MMLKLNLKKFLTSAPSSKNVPNQYFTQRYFASYPDFGEIRQSLELLKSQSHFNKKPSIQQFD